ncbi:hypothetical protein [Novosphingobium sp. G106]|uniref:hypothetical protein n=1 Tax=Novosphingobium sp. G106 TaxID=2849500 RepID=UPI0020C40A48|nr:hypothetical protein [Novosphingobium sp. G106]
MRFTLCVVLLRIDDAGAALPEADEADVARRIDPGGDGGALSMPDLPAAGATIEIEDRRDAAISADEPIAIVAFRGGVRNFARRVGLEVDGEQRRASMIELVAQMIGRLLELDAAKIACPLAIDLACTIVAEDRAGHRAPLAEDRLCAAAVGGDEDGGIEFVLVLGEADAERFRGAFDHEHGILTDPADVTQLDVAEWEGCLKFVRGAQDHEPPLVAHAGDDRQALAARRNRHVLDPRQSAIGFQRRRLCGNWQGEHQAQRGPGCAHGIFEIHFSV